MGAPPRRWPIYASQRMAAILPRLCAQGERHTLVANVIFHCFGSSNKISPRMSKYFKHNFLQTLNYLYSDRSYLEPPLGLPTVEKTRELIFLPLDAELVKEVSPSIRPRALSWLHENIEDSLSRFANYNTRSKENVCINGLYDAVGAEQFLKAMKLMRLQHKLSNEVKLETLNGYFRDTMARGTEIAHIEAMDMTLLLMKHRKVDLYIPFVEGSWRPVDVLEKIVKAECAIAFDMFFSLSPQNIREQAYNMMRTTDARTGLLKYPWGYIKAQSIGSLDREDGSISGTRMLNPPSSAETSVNEHDTFIDVSAESITYLNIHMVDTVVGLNRCLTMLKRYANKSHIEAPLVALHIEKDAIAVATVQESIILDLMVTDPLYKSTLFSFLSWIWANNRMVKIGHRILPKIAEIATRFDRPFVAFSTIVDLNNKRRKTCTNGMIRFKAAGISKSLFGLLQEYGATVINGKQKFDSYNRPIEETRALYMAHIAKGLLEIEQTLREDGWMPTDFCDLDSSDNSHVVDKLEEEIQNSQL